MTFLDRLGTNTGKATKKRDRCVCFCRALFLPPPTGLIPLINQQRSAGGNIDGGSQDVPRGR
eukprot:COSAG06_NODE_1035_length_10999_cov_25.325229_15_plen_62_part_00